MYLTGLAWENYQRLGELQEAVKKSLPEMMDMVKEVLEPRPYTKQEVAALLDTTTKYLDNVSTFTCPSNMQKLLKFLYRSLIIYVNQLRKY